MTKIKSNLVEVHIFRIIDRRLEFLLLKRVENEKYPNIWQMVSGSIRKNETAVRAAKREVREETGLIPKRFFVVPQINSLYLLDKDEILLVPVFGCLVNNSSKITISKEHSEYKWVRVEKAKKMIAWPGQRKAVKWISENWDNEKETIKFAQIILE
ncbi:MAG: NUDIX domain-containing protein [Bacteroidetes bacterium]|nr:NUDIX domain-containing protein [Bacteroidota bacterium]MBU2583844.1 NUDIX domain-containing protein [Bacteroidota bacterium]